MKRQVNLFRISQLFFDTRRQRLVSCINPLQYRLTIIFVADNTEVIDFLYLSSVISISPQVIK